MIDELERKTYKWPGINIRYISPVYSGCSTVAFQHYYHVFSCAFGLLGPIRYGICTTSSWEFSRSLWWWVYLLYKLQH